MRIAESRLTTQGQVSVPREVRRRLGVAPGASISWEQLDTGEIVVRRSGKQSFEDVRARFAHLRPPRPVTIDEMREAVARHLGDKHAGRLSGKQGRRPKARP
jgi:bifunctional DNA-binding transcriptional regulator/antitoxin component of YhaV-PrlF toxin-antitoxin module